MRRWYRDLSGPAPVSPRPLFSPMARTAPRHARPRDAATGGVEGNTRLTSSLAVVLLVLLFLEGLTILQIGGLLTPHVFIGTLLIGPSLVKMASTGWRFVRYYTGDREYVRRGAPPTLLRLLGPLVVLLTVVVLASGVGLLVLPHSWRNLMLLAHKASFVLWFGAMAIHVLGHIVETAQVAPRDWLPRTRREVAGASSRQWALAASLVVGLALAVVVTPHAHGWLVSG
jgi:hypothetical protein